MSTEQKGIRVVRGCCGIWLALLFCITLPWGGFVYAAPVILGFFITRRRSMRAQIGIAAGCLSLLFMCWQMWSFYSWKAAGNYDAQEGLFYLFLLVWQYTISALAMLLTWGLLVARDNLSREYETPVPTVSKSQNHKTPRP